MIFKRTSLLAKVLLLATFVGTHIAVHAGEGALEELRARRNGIPYELQELDRLALPRIEDRLSEIVVYMQPNGYPLFISIGTNDSGIFVYDCNGIQVPKSATDIATMLRESRELGGYQRPFENLCPELRLVTRRNE